MNEIKEVIILAAGRSRRMEHLSNREPKCLLYYKNERILSRLIRQLKENGIEKIVVTIGYKATIIKEIFKNDKNVFLVENTMYEEDVNIYSMKLALEHVSGPCVIFEADTIMEDALVKYVVGSDFETKSVWFTKGKFKNSQYGAIINSDKYGNVSDLQIVASFHDKYKNYTKVTGLMRVSKNEIDMFKILINKYSQNTIKQYYLSPWMENLKVLPCVEADISPFAFFTFNKPEEYYQVKNIDIDFLQETPLVELIDIATMKGIEAFSEERVIELINKINNDQSWTVPVIIENKHHLVLDGQHRLEAAKRMGITKIPAIIINYNDVQVWTLRKEEKVSIKRVYDKALKEDLYPYKTVKHKFNFNVPTVDFSLESLLQKH
ncbi:MAG: NTP transferase domain-containing protein [Bacteroidales bacterium]|jgi:choline kinase|nr:NTP transferase domain-containing protein [Bacteroidales bacterium]